MRWSRLVGTLLIALAVTSCFIALACTTGQKDATTAVPASSDPVARGRYLVSIMSCNDCHTPGYFYGAPDTTRRLSGSDVGWVGPWGVVHARNLTPDSTGIGSWSAEQIVHALRTGNTPDGTQLATIMPWMNYAGVLDEGDAMAIAAYLKSLPPVVHENLPRIPPGQPATGALITMPPPPAWDVRPGAAGGGTH